MLKLPTVPSAELFPIESESFHSGFETYFKGKRQNFFLNLKAFKALWECLQLLNDIWIRESSNLETLTDVRHLLPKTVFMSAHGRFLNAVELGFSCCIGDAYTLLRDAIEAVAHAHRIFKDPSAEDAWVSKHKGQAELEAHDRVFKWQKKKNLFPNDVPGLKQLYFYYQQFCEIATHTSVSSVGKNFEDVSSSGSVRWAFHYFEINPQRMAGFLSALLQVSARMEEVFYGCFEVRLNLDPELVRMRAEFQKVRDQQTRFLYDTYNVGSATAP
ncbi:MAG TPA: hypothetical protein VJN89_04990 [Candidatus Acidoferrum sp.]|nr:hypothetical protein [Candidatus Acidoferrum sp.]